MTRFLKHLISATLIVFIAYHSACADQSNRPPRCIGDVCLGDHIDKYKNRITRGINHLFGPLFVLEDEGRYVSANSDEIDELNWVQICFCHSRGKVKTIQRVIKAKDQHEYTSLWLAYKEQFGMGKPFEHAGDEHEDWWRWEWERPNVTLSLTKKKSSPYITITLHNKDWAGQDWECLDKKALKEKQDEGLVPK